MKKYIIMFLLVLPTTLATSVRADSNQITNFITPVSYFVNHIIQLSAISESLAKFKTSSVVGISGIGKTQLVRTYAYENKQQYNLTWSIDCNLNINQEFLKLAKVLNQERKANIVEEGNTVKDAVFEYLKNKSNWLLVLDNLKIGENYKVKDIINWEHNGHVIFVSQDKYNLPYAVELGNFSQNDCVKLAKNLLDDPTQIKTDFLSNSLDGYPILIVQTSQLLNQFQGLELETYKRKILESSDKIKHNVNCAINKLTPEAKDLLYRIALINNQSFSKNFLKYITSNSVSLDDDIYQILKYSLMHNIDANEENPVFEMHDMIAQTVINIIGVKKAEQVLEKTIDNLLLSTPDTISEFHVFRSGNTVLENFEIISEQALIYNIDLLKVMSIKSYLMTIYNNYSNYSEAEKLIEWLDSKQRSFKISSMNNDDKARYADFLQGIARYYRNRYADFDKSMQYSKKAEEVYKSVSGYKELKADVFYQLALNELRLGNTDGVNKYISELKDTPFAYNIEATLFYLKGNYNQALEKINTVINTRLKKIKGSDLVLTSNYLLRIQILNFLGDYQEGYKQAIYVQNMHSGKKDDHIIFGRIYTQLAKSELGLNKTSEALSHITKAIDIFETDKQSHKKNDSYSENIYLADGYITKGDILFVQNNIKEAIAAYRDAQKIYFFLYKNTKGTLEQVSYLYTQGAKASCKAQDLYHYQCFGKPQVAEFGKSHFNTRSMFEYCEKYNMNLWQEVEG